MSKMLPFKRTTKGKIPDNIEVGLLKVSNDIQRKPRVVLMTWLLSRYHCDDVVYIPFVVTFKSLLSNENVIVTTTV